MITNLLQSNTTSPPEDDKFREDLLYHHQTDVFDTVTTSTKYDWRERVVRSWQHLSLRRKVTLFALAIGIIPIAAVGTIAHHLAAQSLMSQIIADQESRTFDIRQKVSLFTNQVVSDANTVANFPLLTDPQLNQSTSNTQKVSMLNDFIAKHPLERYDSIAIFDLHGNLMLQSESSHPINAQENYRNRDYFKRAIATRSAAVNDPEIHSKSGRNSLEVAAPIVEQETDKILGVVLVRMPLNHWKQMFQYVQAEGWEYRLIDTEGYIFDADESEFIGSPAGVDLEDLPQLQANIQTQVENNSPTTALSATKIMRDRDDQKQVLVSIAPVPGLQGVIAPGWKIALSRPVEEAFAPLRQLRLTLLLGTSVAALVVGAIATVLAHRATLPILAAVTAVKKIGRGELDTQLGVEGQDELADLGTNINHMAAQLRTLVSEQAAEARRSQGLKDLTLKLSRVDNSDEVFQLAVTEILSALQVERALIISSNSDGTEKIMAESVRDSTKSLIQSEDLPSDYLEQLFARHQSSQVQAIDQITQTNTEVARLHQVEMLAVRAEMIAPFFLDAQSLNHPRQYLLVVHQCSQPRIWQTAEIDYFTQLVSQVVLAWERTNLLQQQQADQEKLQQQALRLLTEVEPIGQGDLTTRAVVTDGVIGTLGDSYNSTVENLRQIVLQVQNSVAHMTIATSNNEGFAQSLSEQAAEQSQSIALALGQIETMTESIQAVAVNAEEAESTFKEVLQTVTMGDAAMDRTVAGILDIRETVAETARKVKRLGESSQKISKVVNLISSFAAQTNLLALNASLEASRAGREEHNFSLVAEEIRALSQQSAAATIEIEKIVASIQLDTQKVSKAMEEGIERVVIGTQLVDETRQSLNQVATSSERVSYWIAKIAQETVEESKASQTISQTITDVAAIASITSTDAAQVSASTKKLHTVVDGLQACVSQFKVK
ncbi:MAG: methyl-accepting chemotaxis protein [Cyanobacteria bacterium P01_G01_bin.67]